MTTRYSMKGILGVIGLFAVCFLTFANASRLTSRIVFTVVVLLMLAVLLGSIARRGLTWTGAALFGWAYLIFLYSDVIRLEGHLLTGDVMTEFFEAVHPNSRAGLSEMQSPDPDVTEFWRLGNAYSTLLFAWLGWLVGEYFQRHPHRGKGYEG